MTKLAAWLRKNSERYLMQSAQVRVAKKYSLPVPEVSGSIFWRFVFVPVYRVLPWGVRRPIMIALPGSHRQRWPQQMLPEGPAI